MSYTKTTWVNNTTPINETNLNKIESGIKNNDINIGEENYDNTRTYEVGDIVRYNEKIYKCITAITTAENFDSSKWEQTNIVEIVQSEKSKIYELIEAISTPIVGEGEYITLNDTAEKRFENFDIEGNSKQEATPSPDYPSEVKSCGDNINLFDKDNANKIQNTIIGITGSVGTATANQIVYVECKKNATITVQKKVSTRFRVATYSSTDIVGKTLSNVKVNDAGTSITITSGEKDTYLFVQYIGPDDKDNSATILKTLKIAYSSKETGYSEYGQGCINEVICNKNICNFGSIQNSNIGLTNNLDKNVWKISGTSNANGYTTAFGRISLGKLKAGTYSFSWKYSGTLTYASGGGTGISILNKSLSKIIMDKALNAENKYSKFILTEDTEIALGFWNIGSGNVYSLEIECQLELSETNTEIVEHQSQTYTIPTQQPMRSIGDTRDKFILKENGKWYERHYVQRLILNGTEGWNFDNNNNRFYFGKAGNKGSGYIMSSHYLTGDTTKQNNTCEIWTGAILFRDERYTNVNDWKSYLAEQYANGTPVYVDYVLTTPTDIECTSEQTEILNQMYIKAKTYKGVTHIYSNDVISANCYVEAVKDLTTLIQ